jgi:hypothetical protein
VQDAPGTGAICAGRPDSRGLSIIEPVPLGRDRQARARFERDPRILGRWRARQNVTWVPWPQPDQAAPGPRSRKRTSP